MVASLRVWNGDAEPIGSIIDVWVQIKGIPPKWVDWHTVREVASSIGLMVEIDWQTLFNILFSLMRVKVQCKDPTKVPKKRVYVLNKGLYLIQFKTEGYEQSGNSTDDDSGGVEELEEDDLLDDDPLDKTKEKEEEPKEGHEQVPKEGEDQGDPPKDAQGNKEPSADGKLVKRTLLFGEDVIPTEEGSLYCAMLLETMDIGVDDMEEEDGLEDSDLGMLQEDNEQLHLPDGWVYDLQHWEQKRVSKMILKSVQDSV